MFCKADLVSRYQLSTLVSQFVMKVPCGKDKPHNVFSGGAIKDIKIARNVVTVKLSTLLF